MFKRSPELSKLVIVLSGPPCSGKTTLARSLINPLRATHLQMDEFRQRLFPTSDHCAPTIDRAYCAMHKVAHSMSLLGRNVIVDASYGRYAQRRELERAVQNVEASLYVIQCRVQPEIARERFARRSSGHPAKDLDIERVGLLAERYPYWDQGLTIDLSSGRANCTREVLDYICTGSVIEQNSWSESARQSGIWPGPRNR